MKNWRLKPQLHKQNPSSRVKKLLVHAGGLGLCSSGFNYQIILIPLLLLSLIYSQTVQAQSLSLSENTIENSAKQSFKQPKLPRNGAPTGRRRAGAGRNPECPSSLTRLTALVPGNQGKSFLASTVADYPTFWFYVPKLPKTVSKAEFVLQKQDGRQVQNIYRTPLTLSGKPGIISVTPPAKPQYSLKANQTYHWYFHIYCGDTQATSDNFYVDGFIEKQVLTQALDNQLKTAKPREYLAYSANNIWYDALTNLGQLRGANPQNSMINQDWINLLNSVGLQDFASEPIVEHYNLE
ncbi:MAG: DUF928 domain-containing protein [Richelia sp. RM2_1_2]|nr:DUF928 domain-containing protein [Richelia sp. SM2_1_7]NJM21141.1 DUF928 domain-containing protein [Richelia sp. SM1_7_0]NJN08761.1 DUF928 domain-containing protein [Richelia sp. RM1_1_1]NJO28994.1 DUF928 domain-containing protein [Richelia sp. SL_2_1]NJO60666.1 DUF928 domain-containing protein [Richelia sp. RM2_1_2]